jgi:hypothetical protein
MLPSVSVAAFLGSLFHESGPGLAVSATDNWYTRHTIWRETCFDRNAGEDGPLRQGKETRVAECPTLHLKDL